MKNAAGILGTGWPCAAMGRVEFSAQLSTHDCTATMFVRWFDKAGLHLGDSDALATLTDTPGAADDPDSWKRIGGFATRPAGAAYVRPAIRKSATIFPAINSFLYLSKPQLLEASTTKKKLSPYAPGSTGFIGGAEVQDDAIGPGHISVPSLSAINANVGFLTAGTIQSANFVTGEDGDGTHIDLDTGTFEVNNGIFRRQIAVNAGLVGLAGFTPSATGGGAAGEPSVDNDDWAKPGKRAFVTLTGIPITAWYGQKRTYLAAAGHASGGIEFSSGEVGDIFFGWDAKVLALTRDSGGSQTLRLMLEFWSRNVTFVHDCQIFWQIFQVS